MTPTPTLTTTHAPWSQMRLRQSAHLRDMLSETTFSIAQLIQPIFIVEGLSGAHPITGLGDNARLGEAAALDQIGRDVDAGVRNFLLFAVPASKLQPGATACRPQDFAHVRRSTEAIKQKFGDALT